MGATQSRQAVAVHDSAAPGRPEGSVTNFGGRMLGISPNAKNVEQSWRLIKYLVKPDPVFTKFYDLYAGAAYCRQRCQVARRACGLPAPTRDLGNWGAYATGPVPIPFMWNAVGRAAGAAFIGEKTPAVAARELHETIAKELAKKPG